jgi:hypothetical protein
VRRTGDGGSGDRFKCEFGSSRRASAPRQPPAYRAADVLAQLVSGALSFELTHLIPLEPVGRGIMRRSTGTGSAVARELGREVWRTHSRDAHVTARWIFS